ncbi:DoxX family protein [Chryseolinea lacunae]|uniref:DoxX family protein n=1 Tax=Chryseolinea lacunae TaxID=2801331 RepID=A0ABS1KLS4_9BACT|nr:DoxX family protein [Chryseolinea lacunae]MBL0740433.1 DoxX family protein [Chryseolinea lacunae]
METLAIQTTNTPSKGALWTGRIISGLVILFLLFDSIMKVIRESHHVEGTGKFGFADSFVQPLGIILLVITMLYIIPRTAVIGVLFLTAYFGGAVAVMIQHGENFIFPIVFCALAWIGLLLQYPSLRGFLQLKRR